MGRTSIEHLTKMSMSKFLELLISPNARMQITEKIDGSALSIGRTRNVFPRLYPYIQSATSGPMYDVGEFTKIARDKGYTSDISIHFDNVLKYVIEDDDLQNVLKEYNVDGIKVIGEMLYTPMGEIDGDKIKFIRISYDRSKLGSLLTFVPFRIVTENGDDHSKSYYVMNDLLSISNDERKIVLPNTFGLDLRDDFANILKDVYMEHGRDVLELAKSRKRADKPAKDRLAKTLTEHQQRIASHILSKVQGGTFGDDYEGIVATDLDGKAFKIITESFSSKNFKKVD